MFVVLFSSPVREHPGMISTPCRDFLFWLITTFYKFQHLCKVVFK